MEQKDDKNYVKIMDSSPAPEPQTPVIEAIIHSMPKKYMPVAPQRNQAKITGILILIFGFIILLVMLATLYFLVLKKDPVIEISDIQPETTEETKESQPGQTDQEEGNSDVSTTDTNASSTNDNEQASSTDNKNITNQNTSTSTSNKYYEASDSDKDGLSDLEELAIGSSPNSGDTDGDGYPDLLELNNLYDLTSKGYLLDSLNVEQLLNTNYNYSIFILSLWTVEKTSENDSWTMSLGKDQYMQIISQKNTKNQSVEEWYLEMLEVDDIKDEQLYKKGNWRGVINESKLTVYLEHPSKEYFIILNYEIGNDNTLYYKNIFNMMLRSISVIN